MTVPPGRQCSLPTCEREAVDPLRDGALCEFHLDSDADTEPVTEADESSENTASCDLSKANSQIPETKGGGGTPLEQYSSKGYAYQADGDDEQLTKARDAAVAFTASSRGPPFDTHHEGAGEWYIPGYNSACLALEDAIVEGLLADPKDDDRDHDNPIDDADTTGGDEYPDSPPESPVDDLPSYATLFDEARDHAGTESWEYVPEESLRVILERHGVAWLLEDTHLHHIDRWQFADLEDVEGCEYDVGWYYAAGDETDPEEFRRFHALLTVDAPDGYEPYYFRVGRASKAPATQYGSWKDPDARLDVDEAVAWLRKGGNVGLAGTADGPLVNIDVDDPEAVPEADLKATLRARSRSRWPGGHAWYFDPDGEVPNIPTDTAGEVRTSWQYVVAPGGFVPAVAAELPDDCDRPGQYTVDREEPVATIGYDELPPAFREFHEDVQAAEADADAATPDADTPAPAAGPQSTGDGNAGDGGSTKMSDSAIFDVTAEDVVRREGGSMDPSNRFTSAFHGSTTGTNMSLSEKGRLHCWRHNVAHGGTQALAALSDETKAGDTACVQIGTGHKNSGAGGCRLSGGALVWPAWKYAKSAGYVPPDDPIPHTALRYLALRHGLCEDDDLGDGWRLPRGAYNGALDVVRGEYGLDPGRDPLEYERDGGQYDVQACEPPLEDSQAFDASDRWEQLQSDRHDAAVDADAPVIWKDPAGAGKTTNALLGALDRDRPVAALFDKHEKAREVVTDDALPDDWDPFHLRGAGQKRHALCMDADHAGDACPEHGAANACPSMCPVYDLADDSDLWGRYAALREAVGDVPAHFILGDDLPGHDEDGSCRWLEQFDALEGADHVVGVHEYQQLKTVREDRDVVVDETPRSLRDSSRVTVEGLIRAANALDDLADDEPRDEPVGHTAHETAQFVRELADAVGGGDTPLDALEPPEPTWNAYKSYNSAAGNYVETEPPDEDWQTGEALAQLKHAFNRHLINRIRRDDWGGTPFCIDAVLAAAVEAGAPGGPLRQAIALPAILNACPRCGSALTDDNGAHCCGNCGWDERDNALIQQQGEEARARATLETDTDDTVVALGYETLPLERDLPDDPLVLDATATPSKVAHLYGVDRDALQVAGDDDLAANMHVTQVLDGQYHASTIEDSDAARERIQRSIDTAGRVHDRPLYLVKKGLKPLFEFPDNSDVLHYHAARGLNREECDAVMCIGAPHPKVGDLRREAELLAMARDDVRVGGHEHSTRPDAPNPPVHRKLRYSDDNGKGRAVPTKHYSGLVGDLFRETRENELEQAVHRARPILLDETDDPVDVYLLTNVPTTLPIDEVCSFSELADPLRAMLPVPDSALELLDVAADVAAGDGPDGFRADTLLEIHDGTIEEKVAGYHRLAHLSGRDTLQVTERTVRNWIDALEDLGLLESSEYEQREGRGYSADLSTLKSALQVLPGNAGFKVAAVRRFSALAGGADGTLEWLRWAREAFDLSGDRCLWDRPPDPAG